MQQLIALLTALPPELFNDRTAFVICGSGPMAVRGMRDVSDLDLLVTDDLFKRAPAHGFLPAADEHYANDGTADGDGDCSARRLMQYASAAGKVDLFLTTPKSNHTFDEQKKRGIELRSVGDLGEFQFMNLIDVLMIKLDVIVAKRPSAPKHLADVEGLAAAICREARVVPPPALPAPADDFGL